jgi:excinuclease ABC subunit A
LDVIKVADRIIDLGPEGGDEGGRVIATGTPEQVAAANRSYTGAFLKRVLPRVSAPRPRSRRQLSSVGS